MRAKRRSDGLSQDTEDSFREEVRSLTGKDQDGHSRLKEPSEKKRGVF